MTQREPAVRLRLTRLGWQFAFIGVFAMLGGAIRAYNLPLLLAGLLVGALLLQWRWARLTILAVTLKRRLPAEVFAEQTFTVRFLVTNHARWLPAWLLRIDDAVSAVAAPSPQGMRWRARPAAAPLSRPSCGLGVVPGGQTLTAQYDCRISRRGCYTFGPATLSSGVPLGLM